MALFPISQSRGIVKNLESYTGVRELAKGNLYSSELMQDKSFLRKKLDLGWFLVHKMAVSRLPM